MKKALLIITILLIINILTSCEKTYNKSTPEKTIDSIMSYSEEMKDFNYRGEVYSLFCSTSFLGKLKECMKKYKNEKTEYKIDTLNYDTSNKVQAIIRIKDNGPEKFTLVKDNNIWNIDDAFSACFNCKGTGKPSFMDEGDVCPRCKGTGWKEDFQFFPIQATSKNTYDESSPEKTIGSIFQYFTKDRKVSDVKNPFYTTSFQEKLKSNFEIYKTLAYDLKIENTQTDSNTSTLIISFFRKMEEKDPKPLQLFTKYMLIKEGSNWKVNKVYERCPFCDGTGKDNNGVKCSCCDGLGWVERNCIMF